MAQKHCIFSSTWHPTLSICECKKHNLANIDLFSGRLQSRFAPNRSDPFRDTNKGLRTRQGALSKSPVLFERDRRKVSSLTTGIDVTHYKVSDTSQVQEQLAMKARCLTDSIFSYLCQAGPCWTVPLENPVRFQGE